MRDIRLIKEWYLRTLNLPLRDPDELDDNEHLGIDSMDAVLLADALERDFGVVIETISQGRRAFGSLKGLAAYITENGPAASPHGHGADHE